MRGFRCVLGIAITVVCAVSARATVSVYVPVESLAASAPLVVEGTVVRTASGADEATGAVATYVTLQVEYVHRGPADLTRIVVREPGGRIGDLVNVVDAVPVFEPGERVFVFLSPAPDGALRVEGMFFGKFRLDDAPTGLGRVARRDLSGQGMILQRPAEMIEEFPAGELESIVAATPYTGAGAGPSRPKGRSRAAVRRATQPEARSWSAEPKEMGRLTWSDVREISGSGGTTPSGPGVPQDILQRGGAASPQDPSFVTLSTTYPVRWNESDTATPVAVSIQPGGNPLNDNSAAITALRRSMAAWTNVPEARIVLQSGNENYDFTGTNAQSPATAYPPVNIVLFNDPYNDITDPSGCAGTLAIGGYWRSGSIGKTVNGVTYYPALRQYVIFNNKFECFLGNSDNLAEVGAHELGHGIGFGHSTVTDAIMRSMAYGNGRGPRLGDDDRDGAHCLYPHTLTVTSPDGGESWPSGSSHAITWTATAESGPDPGTVDVELSTDLGASWSAVSAGEFNDGSYAWTVPNVPGSQNLVRVIRHNRVVPTPAPYPEACSTDASNAPFTITASAQPPTAGTAPEGGTGVPLRIDRGGAGAIALSWGASCSGAASDYAIYEGSLDALRTGTWDHVPKTCAAGTDLNETITPGSGNRYYLVAPMAGSREGSLGATSSGAERPPSGAACAVRESSSCS